MAFTAESKNYAQSSLSNEAHKGAYNGMVPALVD